MNNDNLKLSAADDEITTSQLFAKIKSVGKATLSKWKIIAAITLAGAACGLFYAINKKPTYTAECTFVLEDGKGALGQYSNLAALAGISLGNDGGGIFQGDNIIELYKSRLMLKKTMLQTANINGRTWRLIDYFLYVKSKGKSDGEQNEKISFSSDPEKFNRKQDSVINGVIGALNKDVLTVTKPDKKLSIINVTTVFEDEYFSKAFNDELVATVNSFYMQTKTKKTSQNVQTLQKQADSVRRVLDRSISGVASAIDATPNANPAMQSLRVGSQKRQVDVQASSAIYAELVKNLEISKMSLRQETPLIQVIDKPVFPLVKAKLGKIKAAVIGAFLAAFLSVTGLFFRELIRVL